MVPAFSDLSSYHRGSKNVRLFTFTCSILVKSGLSAKEHRHNIPISANHTSSPIAEYSAWWEHHEPKSNSNLPPPREVGLLIVFLWLLTAFNNPLPLIVIKANFFISKGKYMHLSPLLRPNWWVRCLIWVSRLVALRPTDRLRSMSFFFSAIMPRL